MMGHSEKDQIADIVRTLALGGTILYPTDTIWGVGCDATNEDAVQKIYDLKQRNTGKGFVILVSDLQMLREYVRHVHPRIDTLLAYHTRPITVIYDKSKHLPNNVTAPDGSIAVRVANDPFCRELISSFGKPLVATSANVSDKGFPHHFGEISSEIIERVDYVVKYRQSDKSKHEPSVIVRMSEGEELDFVRE
jgi:L-threonylcarbamoyladenylate synthase